MLLFIEYLKTNHFSRVHQSANMLKFRHAYYEACNIMIRQSNSYPKFAGCFPLEQILQLPADDQVEADNQAGKSILEASKEGSIEDTDQGIEEKEGTSSDSKAILAQPQQLQEMNSAGAQQSVGAQNQF